MAGIAGIALALEEDVATAKPESFLVSSSPWHDGHSGAGEDARIRVSNSLPQARQAYSKMGMLHLDEIQ
jgi:hypothetical protein